MGYQSEAELEEHLIAKLETQGYEKVKLPDYDTLINNFRKQLEKFNQDTLDHALTDSEFKRVMNTIDSKTVYASAKQLRDSFTLELDDGREIYMKLFSNDASSPFFRTRSDVSL